MHSCPDCGQACYCNGDLDSHQWDDCSDESMDCIHYEECEQEDDGPMDYGDDYEVAP